MHHQNPEDFLHQCEKYKSLGGIVVALSNLELAHDNFVLAVNKKNPKFASVISKGFPRHFSEKTDFLIQALIRIPELRRMPILDDGFLSLQWLQYQLDELYDLRAVIAHGSVQFTETKESGIIWTLDRIVKTDKNMWGRTRIRVGSSFLACAWLTARVLEHYLHDLKLVVHGETTWEDKYKSDCEDRANHAQTRVMIEEGTIERDELFDWLEEEYRL